MVKSILFGGKAGQGPNILTQLIGEALVKQGYYVFYSRDYQSLIRGGHNFNVISFSRFLINSNESKVDLIVALDEKTREIHKNELKNGGMIISGDGKDKDNMYFAGALYRVLGFDFKLLQEQLKKLRRFDENLKHAKEGFEKEARNIKINTCKLKNHKYFMNGSQGICGGAIKSGLDIYFAYPMTPATPLLFELAPKQEENNFLVLELESEIAVMNAALGASITGAKAMIGTSGGGFDLMTEALSMAGMAEIPIVCYLASRPGPSTGVATYSGQGDLQFARYSGHGEFNRVILAPGDAVECEELTSQAFYFSQKFKVPAIILSDKHLAESFYTSTLIPKITKSEKSTNLGRYNSYEHADSGEASEDAEIIKQGVERREKNKKEIEKEAEKFEMFKIHGNKNSRNVIVSYGSCKGAILDSIKDLDVKFIQVLYIEPFPVKIKSELENAKKLVLVENSATGMLGDVIREKTGVEIKDKILRYDGRAFTSDELKIEIKKKLK
ncbi:MAG: 2-oxoacid:acceptor oxidoreductase family protein [Nanoarchaeota archaeon]|nr:2-oxoacid:acceptor oxidoreductase family protein [Nanoarchaeota archaeon]